MLCDPGARLLGVRQEQGERGLVGDEGFHVAGVVGDQREPRHRATATAEHVRGPVANRLQDPAYVVGQQVRLGFLATVLDRATGEASGVVGHNGVVLGEQLQRWRQTPKRPWGGRQA